MREGTIYYTLSALPDIYKQPVTLTNLDLSRLSPDKSLLFSSVHLERKFKKNHNFEEYSQQKSQLHINNLITCVHYIMM